MQKLHDILNLDVHILHYLLTYNMQLLHNERTKEVQDYDRIKVLQS